MMLHEAATSKAGGDAMNKARPAPVTREALHLLTQRLPDRKDAIDDRSCEQGCRTA